MPTPDQMYQTVTLPSPSTPSLNWRDFSETYFSTEYLCQPISHAPAAPARPQNMRNDEWVDMVSVRVELPQLALLEQHLHNNYMRREMENAAVILARQLLAGNAVRRTSSTNENGDYVATFQVRVVRR